MKDEWNILKFTAITNTIAIAIVAIAVYLTNKTEIAWTLLLVAFFNFLMVGVFEGRKEIK